MKMNKLFTLTICFIVVILCVVDGSASLNKGRVKGRVNRQRNLHGAEQQSTIFNRTSRFRRSSRVCHGSSFWYCFHWWDFYNILKRPIMYNPYFKTDDMKYALYTRRHKKNPYYLKRYHRLNDQTFNPQKATKLIVHGWTQLSYSSSSIKDSPTSSKFDTKAPEWMWDLKDALLERADLNVILVDWTPGSDYHYMKAAPNAWLAGADIALMVKYIKEQTGARPEDFHVIGHSLGGQVASYVGSRLREMGYKLGRITGLDPAEEYFQGMPDRVRLDRSDAEFVDVIHTNGGHSPIGTHSGLGTLEPSGHFDFYVNGGKDQPGCDSDRCSHSRAHRLFLYSVKGRCSYKTRFCYYQRYFSLQAPVRRSYWKCVFISMGYDAQDVPQDLLKTQVNLYPKTTGKEPYC